MRSIAVLLLLSSCVSRPQWTAIERCAASSMILDQVVLTEGHASAIATGGGIVVGARSHGYAESASCRRPVTVAESCEIEAAGIAIDTKEDFSAWWRNLLIGGGYVLYIVPGLVLYVVFNAQSGNAGDDASRAFDRAYAGCMARHATVQGPPGGG